MPWAVGSIVRLRVAVIAILVTGAIVCGGLIFLIYRPVPRPVGQHEVVQVDGIGEVEFPPLEVHCEQFSDGGSLSLYFVDKKKVLVTLHVAPPGDRRLYSGGKHYLDRGSILFGDQELGSRLFYTVLRAGLDGDDKYVSEMCGVILREWIPTNWEILVKWIKNNTA